MAPDVGKLKVGKLPKELIEKAEEEAKKKAKAQVGAKCCSLILPHVNEMECFLLIVMLFDHFCFP